MMTTMPQRFSQHKRTLLDFLSLSRRTRKKPITSLSPFVIEKQIEAIIGTAKSVKKLKNQTLLVETTRKGQTENLKKIKQFFNLPVDAKDAKE